jgi:hypothetical protein
VLNPPAGGPANRLPKVLANDLPSYSLRITASSSSPSATLVLLRRPTAGQQGRPPEAWSRPVGIVAGQPLVVGTFAMREGTGPSGGADPVVHQEPPQASFDLQLRAGAGPVVSCGILLGY